VLFGRRQQRRHADDDQIVDEVRTDALWDAAHEFLLEAGDSIADRRFYFALRFHVPDFTPAGGGRETSGLVQFDSGVAD
jgi:hypothetical protein